MTATAVTLPHAWAALSAGPGGDIVTLDALTLAPALAPALGALVVLLLDALLPRLRALHLGAAILALLVGAVGAAWPLATSPIRESVASLCQAGTGADGHCLWVASPSGQILQVVALLSSVIVLLLLAHDLTARPAGETGPPNAGHRTRRIRPSELAGRDTPAKAVAATTPDAPLPPVATRLGGGPALVSALVLAATAGATAVIAAQDLGSWLVTLELATLPTVALVALTGTRRSGDGALALLTTSIVSFALLAVGAALWLVATGSPTFAPDAATIAWADPQTRAVLVLAAVLMVAGVGFKLSLVPFHAWTPQAYTAGHDAVAALLATTSKVAALGALLGILSPLAGVAGLGSSARPLTLALAVLAALTMSVGNLLALRQDDPVRLLAWSTVAQAGWVLAPAAVLTTAGLDAAAGYLAIYVAATAAAFTVVSALHGPVRAGAAGGASGAGGAGLPRTLAASRGLLRRSPLLGAVLGLALVSLAGLPPGIAGLLAKVVALRPLVDEGIWWLALVAVGNAIVGIAVYARWFAGLLADDPEPPDATHDVAPRALPRATLAAVLLAAALLALITLDPALLLAGLT
ncbi:NADH-quinone oxidoreductase subunit N [Janibacter sp. G1551]|uniref:NADH-quinone oxidoreductase subunit N n=1 Tax=Janibacter sp. G1551 TaxID=3420440 RepID=UPI003D029116